MRRRILFWSERFWPTIGGVGLSASKLLPALAGRGYEFTVVTSKENADLPEEDEFKGIRVLRWPFWTTLKSDDITSFLGLRQRVAGLKRAFAPDLVHINFLGSTVIFHTQTSSVHPAPVLVCMDSAFLGNSNGQDSLARRVLSSADWITCVSNERLARIRRLMPEVISRSSCVRTAIEIPDLKPTPPAFEAPCILCVGRLEKVKGFDLALEAFASVVPRISKARLVIAGDGPERHNLETQVGQLGLGDSVDMLGWVKPDKIVDLMTRSTVVVMPSRDEGLPHVAVEAGVSYRPVVATRVGGISEVVVDGETGLLVEPEDVKALEKALLFLLENESLTEQLGTNARAWIEERFSFDHYVDAYDALYRHLTSSSA